MQTAPGLGPAGEGSSRPATRPPPTLDEVMRAPSTTVPEVVVLNQMPPGLTHKEEVPDPKEDLWISTSDGRYNCPIIPLRVGVAPYVETFYVHKEILIKTAFFKNALCGSFKESETQSIELPEEDPAIFHFVIAFLYEGRYEPIKLVASALVSDVKGKGRGVVGHGMDSDSNEAGGTASDTNARSRRRQDRRRRREEQGGTRFRKKQPGLHLPEARCARCTANGPTCWSCGVPRLTPEIPDNAVEIRTIIREREREVEQLQRRRARRTVDNMVGAQPQPDTPPPAGAGDDAGGERMNDEDFRTWLMAYSHDLDVYICANKFMMGDLKRAVRSHVVAVLESAGLDAARPEVLELCCTIYGGLPESDSLLKMVFARIGFLQPLLWSRDGKHTNKFLVDNPEVAAVILRETASRRELDRGVQPLPSLVRPNPPPTQPAPYDGYLMGYRPGPVRRTNYELP